MLDAANDPSNGGLPAWVISGGVRGCYLNSYANTLAAPMSDLIFNREGNLQSNFRYGYIWWEGNAPACHEVLWPWGWYFQTPSSDVNAFLSLDPVVPGPPNTPNTSLPIPGVQLYMDNRGGTSGWVDAPGIWVAKNYAAPVTNFTRFKWTQYDKDHAFLVGLLVRGIDGISRKLVYGANAPLHWPETGFVDMTGSPSGYNTWLQFSRGIYGDYMAEFGVEPTDITKVLISHFNRDDWTGDHGGTLGGACVSEGTSDCDGDGLNDEYEDAHGCLNVLTADAAVDADADQLTNVQEQTLGTDPCDSDSDRDASDFEYQNVRGDGCSDSKESALALNPLDPWDFFSVPVPALIAASPPAPDPMGRIRDSAVGAGDAQAVFAYFKAGAKTGKTVYEQDLNGNGIKDGIEYDRTVVGPGHSGAPDGVVSATDAQLAFAQFKAGYHC